MDTKFLFTLSAVAALTMGCSNAETKDDVVDAVATPEVSTDLKVQEPESGPAAIDVAAEVIEPAAVSDEPQEVQHAPIALVVEVSSDERIDVEETAEHIELAEDITAEYVCKNGVNERVIRSVKRHDVMACEVTYQKISGIKTLWSARSGTAYCEAQAATFASKQVSWGWSCTDVNGRAVEAPEVESAAVVAEVSAGEPLEVEVIEKKNADQASVPTEGAAVTTGQQSTSVDNPDAVL